jgi:hypothetical protein
VSGCTNKDIEIHHVRNLHRSIHNNVIIIKGKKKKLEGWEAAFAAQKAKQLPLCRKHHRELHNNNLDVNTINSDYLLNV